MSAISNISIYLDTHIYMSPVSVTRDVKLECRLVYKYLTIMTLTSMLMT